MATWLHNTNQDLSEQINSWCSSALVPQRAHTQLTDSTYNCWFPKHTSGYFIDWKWTLIASLTGESLDQADISHGLSFGSAPGVPWSISATAALHFSYSIISSLWVNLYFCFNKTMNVNTSGSEAGENDDTISGCRDNLSYYDICFADSRLFISFVWWRDGCSRLASSTDELCGGGCMSHYPPCPAACELSGSHDSRCK